MSKERTYRACAFIPGENGRKNKYMFIGDLYKDTKTGYLSLKIDSLPLQGVGWLGWVNFFPVEDKRQEAKGPDTEVETCSVCGGKFHYDTKGPVCNLGHRPSIMRADNPNADTSKADDDIPF